MKHKQHYIEDPFSNIPQGDLIIRLKEVKTERNLSLNDITAMSIENGEPISKTTIQRVFADGSENENFRYDSSIRPIASLLLGVDKIEDTDEPEVKALKSLLLYKGEIIHHMETKMQDEKKKYIDKLENERASNRRSIDFLKKQVELKDVRMDAFMDAAKKKDAMIFRLLDSIINQGCCGGSSKCPLKGVVNNDN